MKLLLKNYQILILLSLLVFAPFHANQIPIKNIFDPLFAMTPFKKVLTACMKVRSSIELIHDYCNDPGLELLIDSVVARLTYLQFDLDFMLKNKNVYTFTDIEYLLNIIDCMMAEIQQTAPHYTQEHMSTINHMVATIKNRLEVALET